VSLRFKHAGLTLLRLAAIAVVIGLAVAKGGAQPGPSLFKANPNQREKPVRITSITLEVRDKTKMAIFSGDVQVVQGETDLRCNELTVFYDNDEAGKTKATKTSTAAASGDRGNQRIRRMEAKGSVVMTQVDQRAVGDHADFDVLANTMVLTGNVVVTRGEDVLRGKKLVVNMTTGIYTMENEGSRVEMLIKSKTKQPQASPGPGPGPKPRRSN
jgi:lipopolysaccharide export system protein LptA